MRVVAGELSVSPVRLLFRCFELTHHMAIESLQDVDAREHRRTAVHR